MSPPSVTGPVLVGEFVFDPTTGEIRPAAASEPVVRLPPQPAKLLALLIRKEGELASREEIREALWPDSHVDFDQSVNFCVRQIRAAFGDSAAEPSYIETLPRRGYRLMRSVSAQPGPAEAPGQVGAVPGEVLVGEAPQDSGVDSEAPRETRVSRPLRLLLTGAALMVATIAALYWSVSGASPLAARRLAIMPFELAAEGEAASDLARISEWLVTEFAGGRDNVEVIGPRSTAPYSAFPFPRMQALADDLTIDFVLNARFLERDGEAALIVELIRLDDGTHPWANFYTTTTPWRAIAEDVQTHVSRVLTAGD